MRGKGLVYQRADQLLLVTYSRASTTGAWIAGPFDLLDSGCSNAELATTLRHVLSRTRFDVAHPLRDEWRALTAPFLAAAGVRTWSAFMKGATGVSVTLADAYELVPMRNMGGKQGFVDVEERAVSLPSATSDVALGESVRKALLEGDRE